MIITQNTTILVVVILLVYIMSSATHMLDLAFSTPLETVILTFCIVFGFKFLVLYMARLKFVLSQYRNIVASCVMIYRGTKKKDIVQV